MTGPEVGTAGPEDEDAALAALELAFVADPVMRWFWPDPRVYRASFPRFVRAIASAAFTQGSAHWLDEGRAVALWLPPGEVPDEEALVTVLLESVAPELLEDLSAFGDLVSEHHPDVAHWYLPFVGVDPFVQGRGHGTTLLRHALVTCDREGLPAYLEASTPQSRSLYERLGFCEVAALQAGSSPTVWPMRREPVAPRE